jgi:hypothetical protein
VQANPGSRVQSGVLSSVKRSFTTAHTVSCSLNDNNDHNNDNDNDELYQKDHHQRYSSCRSRVLRKIRLLICYKLRKGKQIYACSSKHTIES